MSQRRPVLADMLLIAERRRRMSGSAAEERLSDEALVSDEIFASDEDQLLESEPREDTSVGEAPGDIVLRKPVAQVSLAKLSWSGSIDHEALQEALLCYRALQELATVTDDLFPEQPPERDDGLEALEVTLRAGDVAVLRSLRTESAALAGAGIVRAARLPERITLADPAARQAISNVLNAYRRASLAHAWHSHLSDADSAQLHRERDETAVAVLSTLRALLGER